MNASEPTKESTRQPEESKQPVEKEAAIGESKQQKTESATKEESTAGKKPGGALVIKNKLWQPISIPLSSGKTLNLPARGEVKVSKKDAESPMLLKFIQQRKVIRSGG